MSISQLFNTFLYSLFYAAPLSQRSISRGPVISTNFPDPSWIQDGDKFYAFSTNSGGRNVPTAQSSDFKNWSVIADHDALPTVGAWSTGEAVWAPDVVRLANGQYVLYYTAIAKGSKTHCVGAATSDTVLGPYEPAAESIACPIDEGGAIDPAGFLDADGKQYVVYKIDGNSIGHGGNCGNGVAPIVPTPLMLQEVSATNGSTPIGDPVQILDRGEADGPLIEAPSLVRVPDATSAGGWLYILFFSSNCYTGGKYDTSYATSSSGVYATGEEYVKAKKPLLVTGMSGLYSPGGLDVGMGPGAKLQVLFHADKGKSADVRPMWAGEISVDIPARTVSI